MSCCVFCLNAVEMPSWNYGGWCLGVSFPYWEVMICMVFYLNFRDAPVIHSTLSPLFIFVSFADILTFFWWTFFLHGNDGDINQDQNHPNQLSRCLWSLHLPHLPRYPSLLGSQVGLRLRQIKLPSAAPVLQVSNMGPTQLMLEIGTKVSQRSQKFPGFERWKPKRQEMPLT